MGPNIDLIAMCESNSIKFFSKNLSLFKPKLNHDRRAKL